MHATFSSLSFPLFDLTMTERLRQLSSPPPKRSTGLDGKRLLGINQQKDKSLSTYRPRGRKGLREEVNPERKGPAGSPASGTGKPLRTTNERRSECNPRSAFRHFRSQSPLARTSQARNAHPAGRKTLPNPGNVTGACRACCHSENTSRKTLARHIRRLRARTEHRHQQTSRPAGRLSAESSFRRNPPPARLSLHRPGGHARECHRGGRQENAPRPSLRELRW